MSHFFGLWQSLININQIVKPDLIIIDGLWGQEGFGPISGTPRQMDVLIAGSNPVAVDAVASRVMGLDPAQVPVCFLAYLQGLGPLEADDIEVLGPKLEEVSQPFQLPELDLSGAEISASIMVRLAVGAMLIYILFSANFAKMTPGKIQSLA